MTASTGPNGAKQGAETDDWSWVEPSNWTERMVSALVNGVEGGKWFSLMDKVYAPKTLALAWARVRANQGAAGVDGQSVELFAAGAETYLAELNRDLQEGTYRHAEREDQELFADILDGAHRRVRLVRPARMGCPEPVGDADLVGFLLLERQPDGGAVVVAVSPRLSRGTTISCRRRSRTTRPRR